MTIAAAAPAAKKKSDLALRSVTGIALIVVALCALIYGQEPFWILISLAALVMFAEWCGLIRAERWQMWLGFLGLILPLFIEEPHANFEAMTSWVALIGATLVVGGLTRSGRVAAGLLYAGLPVLSLFYLRDQYDGIDLAIWSLVIVWATDIGAYFAGRAIGGPKLAPALSPNKTWAGLIGGMIAATLVGLGLTCVLHVQLRLAAFSGVLAALAQGGDLFESWMKRRAGVKDSGKLLPGHGGVMDRLDGAVPVLCIVALIVASGIL